MSGSGSLPTAVQLVRTGCFSATPSCMVVSSQTGRVAKVWAKAGSLDPRNRPFITLPKSAELTVREYFDGGWRRPYDEASDDAPAPASGAGRGICH